MTKWFLLLIAMTIVPRFMCYYYNPACSQQCSQLIHDDGIDYINTGNKGSCAAQLDRLDSFETIPLGSGPVLDINVADYILAYINTDVQYYSAVNITYKFNQECAGSVFAVNFTIKSVSPDDDDNYLKCRGYKFNKTLTMKDIQDGDGNYEHYFDCLRGQRPGYEYEYTISLESNSSFASQVYRFYYRIPACSFRPTDYLCKFEYGYENITENELPKLWKSQYLTLQSEEYEKALLQFEVAPDEYGFNVYDIVVLNADGSLEGTGMKIDVNSSDIQETVYFRRRIRFIEVNLTNIHATKQGSDISVMVVPAPCMNSSGMLLSCSQTQSRFITIYENPCKTEICGKHEKCIHLSPGLGHECVCEDGYKEFVEGLCEVNKCFDENPCGHGNCTATSGGYTCECDEDYILHGSTCKLDLCASKPCKPNGNCKLLTNSDKLSYTCDCGTQYVFNETTCIEDRCNTSDPCGINSKQCNVLANPICTCTYNYVFKEGKGCVVSPGILAAIVLSCAMFVCVILLVVFCWKCKDKAVRIRSKIPCCRSQTAPACPVSKCPNCGYKIAWEHDEPNGNEPLIGPGVASSRSTSSYKPQRNVKEEDIKAPSQARYVHDENPDGIELITNHTSYNPVGHQQPCSSRIILKSMMTTAKILILSSTEDLKHNKVVEAFANLLLMDENKFIVVLPSWDELQIAAQGWQTWLRNKLNWAHKVIVVLPQATQRINSVNFKTCNRNFLQGLDYIINICGSQLDRNISRKFQLVHFENSHPDTALLPTALKNLITYKLMKDMEALYFKLHDIEQYEPGKEKEAPWLKEDSYYKSQEGYTLLTAIHNMRNHPVNNNDEVYLPRPPSSSHLSDTGTGDTFDREFRSISNRNAIHNVMNQPINNNIDELRLPRHPSDSHLSDSGTADTFEKEFRDITNTNPKHSDFDSVNGNRDMCNSLHSWYDGHISVV
ncbi:uncharacterized protein [Amphiura filiformis]|uniref:uncharacterized protein n=1 Tax=Amphiura filiformis TaxID=82378 RepID=UPI003B22029C